MSEEARGERQRRAMLPRTETRGAYGRAGDGRGGGSGGDLMFFNQIAPRHVTGRRRSQGFPAAIPRVRAQRGN